MEERPTSQTDLITKLEALLGSAQRGSVTCPKSHSKFRTELGLEFRPKDVLACSSSYQLLHSENDG